MDGRSEAKGRFEDVKRIRTISAAGLMPQHAGEEESEWACEADVHGSVYPVNASGPGLP